MIQLGRIVVNANELESYITYAIFMLTSEPTELSEEYRLIMSIIWKDGFEKRLHVLDNIFKAKVEDLHLIDDFNNLRERTKSLYSKRNAYVHSDWAFAEDDSYVGRMRNLKYLRTEFEPYPPVKNLSQLADELSACAGELANFMYNVKEILKRQKND